MTFATKQFQYVQYTKDNLEHVLLFLRAKILQEKDIRLILKWFEQSVWVSIIVNNGLRIDPTDYILYYEETECLLVINKEVFEKHYVKIEPVNLTHKIEILNE